MPAILPCVQADLLVCTDVWMGVTVQCMGPDLVQIIRVTCGPKGKVCPWYTRYLITAKGKRALEVELRRVK